MTRVNLVPVNELSDQHLIAEYRELPRCIIQDINISDAPVRYQLNKGHMKWAKRYSKWSIRRYQELCDEMIYRGFRVNHPFNELYEVYLKSPSNCINDYEISVEDLNVSKERILERYNRKPNFYRWTKRVKPKYY